MFIPNTEVGAVGGQMPGKPALPTSYEPGWPTGGSAPAMPNPSATDSLPIMSPSAGNTDTGVGHSGDLGGAGAR